MTFDFWNTLYADSRDLEVERDAWRLHELAAATGEGDETVLRDGVETTRAEWYRVWRNEGRTPGPAELADYFTRAVAADCDAVGRASVLRAFQEAALRIPPRPIDGALDLLRTVAARTPIALISDTGFTPGRVLRQVLAQDGVLDLFTITVFSDETGAAKPDPRPFRRALAALGAEARDSVHLGDLVETDVRGAQALGMRAVLFRRDGAPGGALPRPDAVVARLVELPALLETW